MLIEPNAIKTFTHFKPAQPTTVDKCFAMWLQDFWLDAEELQHRKETFRFLGIKGATGTQASFLKLFEGYHQKVKQLEELMTRKLGFTRTFVISGQTYTRKQDTIVLNLLAGIAASAHKMCTDLRLLAHKEEIEETFDKKLRLDEAGINPRKKTSFEKFKRCKINGLSHISN